MPVHDRVGRGKGIASLGWTGTSTVLIPRREASLTESIRLP